MNNSNQKICYACNLTKHNEIESLHSLCESADSILVPLLKLLEVKDLINSPLSPSCRTTVECPTKKLVTSILSEMLELYQEQQEREEARKNMLLEEMEFIQILLTIDRPRSGGRNHPPRPRSQAMQEVCLVANTTFPATLFALDGNDAFQLLSESNGHVSPIDDHILVLSSLGTRSSSHSSDAKNKNNGGVHLSSKFPSKLIFVQQTEDPPRRDHGHQEEHKQEYDCKEQQQVRWWYEDDDDCNSIGSRDSIVLAKKRMTLVVRSEEEEPRRDYDENSISSHHQAAGRTDE
jgi:hypothetical protein